MSFSIHHLPSAIRLPGRAALAILALLAAGPLGATPASPIGAFLEKHCYDCHDGTTKKGGLDLEKLAPDFGTRAERMRWTQVFDRLEQGEMPPAKKPQPGAAERKAALQWIGSNVYQADVRAHAAEGRALSRRLNREEYQNTIRDLLFVDVDVKKMLPEDGSYGGFDNVDLALDTSAAHLEVYLQAADVALKAALAQGARPETKKQRITYWDANPKSDLYKSIVTDPQRNTNGQIIGLADAVIFTNETYPPKSVPKFKARAPGRYRFRLSAYAWQSQRPVTAMVFVVGDTSKGGRSEMTQVFSAPPGEPKVFEWEEDLAPGEGLWLRTREPNRGHGASFANYKGPGLAVQWIEAEGPIIDAWPPPRITRLLGGVDLANGTLADAEKILRAFLPRAFRRPIADADVEPYIATVRAWLAGKDAKFEPALLAGLKMALASPDFLYLQPAPGRLDEHALAARLSYFLWSSMPDDELLALAAQKKLAQPATLRAQVERMLADKKAAAFTENFTGQWLRLREIDATQPDKKLYPEYDDLLGWSMVRETRAFFDEMLRSDLGVLNFVASDFTVLNARLAEHYGIPGVDTMDFRKVALKPEWHRGGVLTQASVLKVTANGTSTSPIPRGAFVLSRIIGRPVPPPPEEVPALEADVRGATSIREKLELHRADAACAVCHDKMDPPGSALENYDVIGGWREFYRKPGGKDFVVIGSERMDKRHFSRGAACETDGTLPSGAAFKNADDFRRALLADPALREQIVRGFASRLLVYATGHALDFADRATVSQLLETTRPKQHGLRSLVHAVVQSPAFLNK